MDISDEIVDLAEIIEKSKSFVGYRGPSVCGDREGRGVGFGPDPCVIY